MSKGKELIQRAKTELLVDMEKATVAELKERLMEIIESEKTLSLMKQQLNDRIAEIDISHAECAEQLASDEHLN